MVLIEIFEGRGAVGVEGGQATSPPLPRPMISSAVPRGAAAYSSAADASSFDIASLCYCRLRIGYVILAT